jgi:hypothetical protein
MALRQTTPPHTTEALQDAQLLVLPVRVDATRSSPVHKEETVMDQSLSDRPRSANRKLRNAIILGNVVMWLAIIAVVRFLVS